WTISEVSHGVAGLASCAGTGEAATRQQTAHPLAIVRQSAARRCLWTPAPTPSATSPSAFRAVTRASAERSVIGSNSPCVLYRVGRRCTACILSALRRRRVRRVEDYPGTAGGPPAVHQSAASQRDSRRPPHPVVC